MDTETPLKRPLRIIGLTGGVGMGKTTVSDYLHQAYGLPILDADLYARQVVEPGTWGLAQLAARYGEQVLQADGALDRQKLAEILFDNAAERDWIEQLIHPAVRRQIEAALQVATQSQTVQTVVVVVPLLFEAQMSDLVTEIWVVSLPETQQLQRLQQRDRLSLAQAQARISSQMPIAQKIAQADRLLDNSGSRSALLAQIDRALNEL